MVRVTGVVFLLVLFAGIIFADDLMELKDQGGTPRFKIDPNGNVGVGNNILTPGNLLEIRKDVASVGYGLLLNNQQGGGWGSSLSFSSNYTGLYDAARIIGGGRTSQGNGALYFETANSTGGLQTRMTIDNNGYVGIGETSPSAWGGVDPRLHLKSSYAGFVQEGEVASRKWQTYVGSDGAYRIADATGGANRLFIATSGNVGIGIVPSSFQLDLSTDGARKLSSTAWTTGSDERIKKEIRPFTDGLKTVEKIDPVWYQFNGKAGTPNDGKDHIGVIAQQIAKAAPYTVDSYKAKMEPTDAEETELFSFNSHALTFVLINSVKELNEENKKLKDEIKKQKEDFESRLKAIEEKLAK